MREVARELGVAYFVEGSVQKVDRRVRINVQLIRASANDHLWAQIYDRNPTDIFAVESEVATAITDSLKAKLSGREREAVAATPTLNLDAYDVYLRGLDLYQSGMGSQTIRASEAFRDAVRLDPSFSLAWAKLAEVDAALYFKQLDATPARKESARIAAETATKLQPEATATALANAFYRYHVLRDYQGARVLFEKVRRKMPNNSEALWALALVARRQGHWNESLRFFSQAAELNPRSPDLLADWSWTLSLTRQFSVALQILDQALKIRPSPELWASKATVYQSEGNLAAAADALAKIRSDSTGEPVLFARIAQLFLERKHRDLVDYLQNILPAPGSNAPFTFSLARLSLAQAQELAGNPTAAHATFAQTRADLETLLQQQPNNVYIVAGLAAASAGLGDKEAALRQGERSLAMLSVAEDPLIAPGIEELLARVEAQVGEQDRPLGRLERLLTTPCGPGPITLALLRLDPAWDALRSNPRFRKLISEPKTIYQ